MHNPLRKNSPYGIPLNAFPLLPIHYKHPDWPKTGCGLTVNDSVEREFLKIRHTENMDYVSCKSCLKSYEKTMRERL